MSDHDFNGRVVLGVSEPDAPDPEWKYDTWVLRFQGDRRALAAIGAKTGRTGLLAIRDKDGHEWNAAVH